MRSNFCCITADKAGHIEDIPLGLAHRVVAGGPDEHVAPEQGLPGGLGGD